MENPAIIEPKNPLVSLTSRLNPVSISPPKIAMTAGDGIGPEIAEVVTEILAAAKTPVEWLFVEMGQGAYNSGHKNGISENARQVVERTGVLLKGPMATPKGGGHKSVNVTARKMWSTFANKRVFRSLPGVPTLFSKAGLAIDLTIVRENIEDTYGGIEHMLTHDVALCRRLITRPGSLQVHRYAFEVARRKRAGRVTCAHKANIMKLTDGLFLRCFYEVAAEYPEIRADDIIIDDLAMKLVSNPTLFDVIVLPNLQGDIISDLCAGLVGGLGFAPSANIGSSIAIFEAVHGTAPDLVGRGVANPTALLLSATMMLRHVGLGGHAQMVESALLRALDEGYRTPDFGEGARAALGTKDFARAIIDHMVDTSTLTPPQPWTVPRYSERPAVHETSKPTSQKVVGLDIFVESSASAPSLAKKVSAVLPNSIALTMISNRGMEVWPNRSEFTECVNQYRLRLESRGAEQPKVTEEDMLAMAILVSRVVRVCSTEILLEIDGTRAFSMAQGQG